MICHRPVLILDSGVGGLTVLREVRFKLPYERLVYVIDDAAFPYGGWDEIPLAERLIDLVGRQIELHDPKVVLIACNTAFTLVGEALRAAFPDMAFVGTVPAIKPAAHRTRSGLISVLATPGTVRRAYTRDLIARHASNCHVRLVGSDLLAEMAEAHLRGDDTADADLLTEIADCFLEDGARRTDIIVLACTHYPFLANRFREIAPWPVDWIDPAEAIARQLARVVETARVLPAGNVSVRGVEAQPDQAIFTSGRRDADSLRLLTGFGLSA
ncbi:glutamate racemase [Roseibium algae]|uniref:Glutamate racemase n=1 Tax=Roseibium algae TaxID=3123038 RepID=A0ABU8TMQ7_9HYPH